MVLRNIGCLYNFRFELWCLSKENWLPSKDLLAVVRSRKSLKRNPTSSFSDLVFFRMPQCRNFLGPTELVRELKVIFSCRAFSSVCRSTWIWSHSSRSEFSFIRMPSFTYIQGDFFNWPPPEFAKCWPVSNWFQKNVRVPDWPPLWLKIV